MYIYTYTYIYKYINIYIYIYILYMNEIRVFFGTHAPNERRLE